MYDFMQQADASASQAGNSGGPAGIHLPLVSAAIPEPQKDEAVPFTIGVLPSFHGIQTGDLNKGMAIFSANLFRGVCGTNHWYYTPTQKFPEPSAVQPGTVDLFDDHLTQVMVNGKELKYTKSDLLNDNQKDYRKGINSVHYRLMQVVLMDHNLMPIPNEDGTYVRLFAIADKFYKEQQWDYHFRSTVERGVSVVDVRAGHCFMGTRTGKSMATRYGCVGAFQPGQPYAFFRDASGMCDEAMVSRILSEVKPWEQVMDVLTNDMQKQYLDQWVAAKGACVGLAGAQPAQAGPAQPGSVQPGQVNPSAGGPTPAQVPAGQPGFPQPGAQPTVQPGFPAPGGQPAGQPTGQPGFPGAQPAVQPGAQPGGQPGFPQPGMPQPGAQPGPGFAPSPNTVVPNQSPATPQPGPGFAPTPGAQPGAGPGFAPQPGMPQPGAQPGGQPGPGFAPQPGAQPAGQPGMPQPGAQPGGQPAVQPGYPQPGGQPGFPQPGMPQPGGQPAVQPGYPQPGGQPGFPNPTMPGGGQPVPAGDPSAPGLQ